MKPNLNELESRIELLQEEINGLQEQLSKLKIHLAVANACTDAAKSEQKRLQNIIDKMSTGDTKNETDKH